jgi:hypothetical protein
MAKGPKVCAEKIVKDIRRKGLTGVASGVAEFGE